MTNQRPMFPHVIDSSMLSTFRSCPYKFFRQYIEHWKPRTESVHLIAGGAFAKGIEMARRAYFEQGFGKEDSEAIGLQALLTAYGDFECPTDSNKTAARMVGALEYYFDKYSFGVDGAIPITNKTGRRGIEFSFAEPLDFQHPITGDPILFCGRADMIADYAGGVFGFDEKTTTQLGGKWAGQWDLRSQFTSYSWAGKRNNIPMQGTIVRGISILKNGYDTQQVISYRADWEIERWELQIYRDLHRMLQMWFTSEYDCNLDGSCSRSGNPWDRNDDSACNDYGGCSFRQVCKSREPEMYLQTDFEQRVWDPMAHKEISVADWEKSWGHESDRNNNS